MAKGTISTKPFGFKDLNDSVSKAIILVTAHQHGNQLSNFDVKKMPLAELRIYDIAIDAITIERRPEDIAQDGIDDYFLTTLTEGSANITQGDNTFHLEPGELAVLWGGAPYATHYPEHSHRLILQMPKHIFFERILGREDNNFEPGKFKNTGLTPIVTNLFKSLAIESGKLTEIEQHTLAASFLELAGAVIRAGAKPVDETHITNQPALMRRILSYMDEQFTDCELTPERVAKANGISMRYLHRLFQQSGTTVCKWIWERRLKATREDLLNPGMAKMRISEIAFRRGFNDPAHFSRSFRDRFGISPSKLRNKANEEQDSAA
jgi:AraC-like DNA-binding protein